MGVAPCDSFVWRGAVDNLICEWAGASRVAGCKHYLQYSVMSRKEASVVKLFYYKDARGNFGDDLNPLIWYSQYPELFSNQSSQEIVVGIGTLINDRAPREGVLHVLGSGVGYHGPIKDPGRWIFHFVRGPLSAQALGLDANLALTDPAILIRRIFPIAIEAGKSTNVGFMPHHASLEFANWREICGKAGLLYLDPAEDVATLIHLFRSCRLIIAEAMHAAIVADALRIPWVAVKAYPQILDFKWNDWCQSMGVGYRPIVLEPVWDVERIQSKSVVFKSAIKRQLISLGFSGVKWTPPYPANNRRVVEGRVIESLVQLSCASGSLSDEHTHLRLLEKVDETIRSVIAKVVN